MRCPPCAHVLSRSKKGQKRKKGVWLPERLLADRLDDGLLNLLARNALGMVDEDRVASASIHALVAVT